MEGEVQKKKLHFLSGSTHFSQKMMSFDEKDLPFLLPPFLAIQKAGGPEESKFPSSFLFIGHRPGEKLKSFVVVVLVRELEEDHQHSLSPINDKLQSYWSSWPEFQKNW